MTRSFTCPRILVELAFFFYYGSLCQERINISSTALLTLNYTSEIYIEYVFTIKNNQKMYINTGNYFFSIFIFFLLLKSFRTYRHHTSANISFVQSQKYNKKYFNQQSLRSVINSHHVMAYDIWNCSWHNTFPTIDSLRHHCRMTYVVRVQKAKSTNFP